MSSYAVASLSRPATSGAGVGGLGQEHWGLARMSPRQLQRLKAWGQDFGSLGRLKPGCSFENK